MSQQNNDYKFKSELTKKALPTGYSHLIHVSRDEVPGLLSRIKALAENCDWIKMYAVCQVDGDYHLWTADRIQKRINALGKDISMLKSVLTRHPEGDLQEGE
ncbi:MAG: hypothetical protein CMF62_06320 [Magnetococcales bacterium]|nr:hypothetical protein [Magnetococcales bacterium]|tara:strand:+ start:295147 stop:295452 length:306 start_codon:yes stop_codon:yes gene_type:complete